MKARPSNPFCHHLFTLAALLAAPLAHAADGTWNGISGNWTDTTNPGGVWSSGIIADGIDSTANFTGIDIAVDTSISLNGINRTIGNIIFTDDTTSSNNLAITGNTLTLDRTNPAVPVIDVTQAGRTLSISSIVAGTDGLQKNGAGNLILTGANTYTGDTTINGGTLQIGNGGTTGSLYSPTISGSPTPGNLTFGTASSIVNNGALVYNIAGGFVNVNQTISGTGTVSVTGNQRVNFAAGTNINTTGSQTYSATNTSAIASGQPNRYWGFTLTDSATVALSSSASTISMTGMLGTANGNTGNLNINTSAGNGNVTLNVAVAVSNVNFGLNSLNVTAGTGTISLGTFDSRSWGQVNSISLTGGAINSTVSMTGFTTLTVANSAASAFSGALTGGGALLKSGAGKLTLSNSGNNYTGTTTISEGTLQIGGGGRIGNGNYSKVISIASGATLQYSSSAGQTLSGAITGLGGITLDTTSGLTLSSTSNTYSGTTTISAGRLAVTAATNLSSGATSIVQSGTGQLFINNTSGTFNNPFNISTTGFAEVGDSQNNVNGAIRMGSGLTGSMSLSNTITLAGNSRISGFLGVPGTLVNTISGQITGGFGIDFYGFQTVANTAEVFVLSNTANDYTGTTTIYNSNYNTTNLTGVSTTLRLGASSVIPDGANAGNVAFAINGTNNNATIVLDLNGFSETINGLTVNAGTFATRITNTAVATSASVLTIGANDTTSAFSGTITDSGAGRTLAITKIGIGNLTLSGSNNYIGGTIIDGGTLTLGHATNTLANGGAVNVNGGTLALGTNIDTVGAVTLTSGSITGTGAGTLTGTGSAFEVRSGSVSAKLGGTVGLNKSTAGTVTLSGANTYTGATTVTAGTLVLGDNAAAGTSAGGIAISGTSAATLQINLGITTADNITFSNTNTSSKVVRDVAIASAYNTGTTGILSSSFVGGQDDTTAQILEGTRSVGTTLEMLFADTAPGATNDNIRRSDVFTTAGTSTDTYVIQLSTGALAADSVLGWLSGTTWVHAGSIFNPNTAFTNIGTFGLGNYGFDNTTNSVWAVVNHDGSFAAVPEPTSALVGLLITAGLLRRRRLS